MEEQQQKQKPDTSSAMDQIETPIPAQEIYPLKQSLNDGKHTAEDMEQEKSYKVENLEKD